MYPLSRGLSQRNQTESQGSQPWTEADPDSVVTDLQILDDMKIGMSETQARRLAEQQGMMLRKVRTDSSWYPQYGPFMLVNTRTNAVEHYGMDLESVAAELIGVSA